MSTPPDTVFSVPGHGGDNLLVALVLDVPDPDLTPVENLLTPTMLDVLAQAAAAADQPYSWAADHIVHAIDHLRAQEYVHAWPPLVIGVEGLLGGGRAARPHRRRRALHGDGADDAGAAAREAIDWTLGPC